jgi:hypothetical protein
VGSREDDSEYSSVNLWGPSNQVFVGRFMTSAKGIGGDCGLIQYYRVNFMVQLLSKEETTCTKHTPGLNQSPTPRITVTATETPEDVDRVQMDAGTSRKSIIAVPSQ